MSDISEMSDNWFKKYICWACDGHISGTGTTEPCIMKYSAYLKHINGLCHKKTINRITERLNLDEEQRALLTEERLYKYN